MNWVLTLLAGVAGWQLAARWKLPAPAMLGSMLAVGLTNILFDYAALPMAVKVFAQAISGAFIGMQIGRKDVALSLIHIWVPASIICFRKSAS